MAKPCRPIGVLVPFLVASWMQGCVQRSKNRLHESDKELTERPGSITSGIELFHQSPQIPLSREREEDEGREQHLKNELRKFDKELTERLTTGFARDIIEGPGNYMLSWDLKTFDPILLAW